MLTFSLWGSGGDQRVEVTGTSLEQKQVTALPDAPEDSRYQFSLLCKGFGTPDPVRPWAKEEKMFNGFNLLFADGANGIRFSATLS